MASTLTPWSPDFSPNPTRRARRGRSLPALLQAIGRERVVHPAAPPDAAGAPLSRLELLARVLWTRATVDGDLAAIKLLLEHLPAAAAGAAGHIEWTADDYAAAQALLAAAWAPEEATADEPSP